MMEHIRDHSRAMPMRMHMTTAERPRFSTPRFIPGLRSFAIA